MRGKKSSSFAITFGSFGIGTKAIPFCFEDRLRSHMTLLKMVKVKMAC